MRFQLARAGAAEQTQSMKRQRLRASTFFTGDGRIEQYLDGLSGPLIGVVSHQHTTDDGLPHVVGQRPVGASGA